jgi:hypothetical protein
MTEPPRGFLLLGGIEVGDELARPATLTASIAGGLGLLCLLLSLAFAGMLLPGLVALLAAGLSWRRAQQIRDIPFAVNANHPWVLEEPMGKAEVAVRSSEMRWTVLGDLRLKLHTDPLLGDPLVVEDHEPWDTVVRWPQTTDARLHRWLTIGNTALALRDAVNGHDEEAEEQRRRAAGDTDLLERTWPEEEDVLEEGSALSRWLETAREKE